jgi:hypothetical protein
MRMAMHKHAFGMPSQDFAAGEFRAKRSYVQRFRHRKIMGPSDGKLAVVIPDSRPKEAWGVRQSECPD